MLNFLVPLTCVRNIEDKRLRTRAFDRFFGLDARWLLALTYTQLACALERSTHHLVDWEKGRVREEPYCVCLIHRN